MSGLSSVFGFQSPDTIASEPILSEGEAQVRVQSALNRMKPAHRAVFVLFELEGLPGDQIAQIEQCPVATVWRRLHYARKEFEQHVRDGMRDGEFHERA